MDVPVGVWISAVVIVGILAWITFWITNKAYSRKWDENDEDKLKN
ncbi:hypothetical protein ABEW34_25255 [Paenibacillus algorifonticola]|nr:MULTISPECIES: hypothetical protein [unclassified Paenibacillus]